ncbi:Aldo/keto reductase [Hesseltinella vesiculosa]|uniref:Aldo/keto reductase n=1 Tax=Hesseltinella vesiculosa TaxID=101127 RepID=A0A1X2G9M0_9FUNG|nr:Aldo/keto reductase [Hesseltinella vesiculosa]
MASNTYMLHNGGIMPAIGLGTYRMKTVHELEPVVTKALQHGYRLIDSATVYRNEEALGLILKKVLADPDSGIERGDLFVTSKLTPADQGYDKCYQAVLKSLERFGLDYLDLYLIHWPGSAKTKLTDPKNRENRMASYRALEKLYEEGKIKQIGVSNYTVTHLQDLLDHCKIVPHVHQFELHPCLFQKDLVALCERHNIQVQAYSSLGEGALINGTVPLPHLKVIADKHNTTEALVLLRWAIEHRWAIIPKSKSPDRVQENASVWDVSLAAEDIQWLDQVQDSNQHRFCWDPTEIA